MSNVIAFPAHKLYPAGVCEACGGITNTTLPTHCPGEYMSLVQQLAVKHGDADFVDGKWVYYEKTSME